MTTATTRTARTAVTRAAKLRRAAVVSGAVLAMGAFAGCGGADRQAASHDRDATASAPTKQAERPPASSYTAGETTDDAPSGSWESENAYAAQGKKTFMASCERSSGGKTSFCQCALDELEQAMSFEEFLTESLHLVKGDPPSQTFREAVKSCAPGSSEDSDGPLDLS